jgi:SET domain-containing protein
MVPHYRQLVENFGGQFLHHDGGKEASRNLLPKMLITADAVFCPVDCVSHDACNCVKKMCKRFQKPFVLMRSAGLSSLAKGLNDIVQ